MTYGCWDIASIKLGFHLLNTKSDYQEFGGPEWKSSSRKEEVDLSQVLGSQTAIRLSWYRKSLLQDDTKCYKVKQSSFYQLIYEKILKNRREEEQIVYWFSVMSCYGHVTSLYLHRSRSFFFPSLMNKGKKFWPSLCAPLAQALNMSAWAGIVIQSAYSQLIYKVIVIIWILACYWETLGRSWSLPHNAVAQWNRESKEEKDQMWNTFGSTHLQVRKFRGRLILQIRRCLSKSLHHSRGTWTYYPKKDQEIRRALNDVTILNVAEIRYEKAKPVESQIKWNYATEIIQLSIEILHHFHFTICSFRNKEAGTPIRDTSKLTPKSTIFSHFQSLWLDLSGIFNDCNFC